MQHVRRAVARPVRRPGVFTQETLTSCTGQTGADGPFYAGTGCGTYLCYIIVLWKNKGEMVRIELVVFMVNM